MGKPQIKSHIQILFFLNKDLTHVVKSQIPILLEISKLSKANLK